MCCRQKRNQAFSGVVCFIHLVYHHTVDSGKMSAPWAWCRSFISLFLCPLGCLLSFCSSHAYFSWTALSFIPHSTSSLHFSRRILSLHANLSLQLKPIETLPFTKAIHTIHLKHPLKGKRSQNGWELQFNLQRAIVSSTLNKLQLSEFLGWVCFKCMMCM